MQYQGMTGQSLQVRNMMSHGFGHPTETFDRLGRGVIEH
jgi:hypothetical protein